MRDGPVQFEAKANTIRALIVAPDRSIAGALSEMSDASILVTRVATPKKAIDTSADGIYDVVLFAAGDEPGAVLDALRACLPHFPGAPLIAIGEDVTESMAVDAILAGADDFVSLRELSRGTLVRAIARNAQRAKRKIMRGTDEWRFHLLLESQEDLLCSWLPDTTLRYANDFYCRFYGIGKDGIGTLKWIDLVPAQMRESVFEIIQTLLTEKKPLSYEHEAIAADGSVGWQEWRDVPVVDERGEIVEILSIGRDITKRKQAELALKESEERFRTLYSSMKQGVAYVDDTCVITDANPAAERILGRSRGQLLGMTLEDPCIKTVGEDGRALSFGEHPAMIALATGKPVLGAVLGVESAREGNVRWIMIDAVPQSVPGAKKPRQAYVTLTDITALKNAEAAMRRFNEDLESRVNERTARLAEANRELEAFSYTVSHDLRGPLRHIAGFAEMLAEHAGESLDERGRHYISVIGESVDRMERLIDGILALTRVGRTELEVTEVELDRLVRDILISFEPDLEQRDIDIIVHDMPNVRADAVLLGVALRNLIENAIKFTGNTKHAVLEIGHTRTAGTDTFFVRDNGAGFDMEYADRLFKAFERLHPSEDFGGMGIGLPTVKRIIERHGGTIRGESGPDGGATFYFTLGAAAT
ncbi:MAG TPA: PAS domain S-box protein [Spirochaetota bacterium]|nr:PAS domain S-box protein [Spirochaetota bacterium]HNT13003.1 PAS domain S-box protein [Spirochaetota bacterium]